MQKILGILIVGFILLAGELSDIGRTGLSFSCAVIALILCIASIYEAFEGRDYYGNKVQKRNR
jgi:hypothetical protein